ncbi:MAG: HEAT repeat domain-containing protein [Terriglobia bacterium]
MNRGWRRSILTILFLCTVLFFVALFPAQNLFATALPFAQEAPSENAAEEQAQDYAWAPALLYGIISSSSPEALNALYDAAFTAGPSIVPQLDAALKDDRTAEFAAQSLAFIGGEEAFTALSKLVNDPRDLGLSQYYYGALGELETPQANDYLLGVIHNANRQPDRTVTEAAIIALTVHSAAGLVPQLKQAEAKLTDPVIQDDLDNAISVIQSRAQYEATHKNTGGSLQQALNFYFEPAFESGSAPGAAGAADHAAPKAQSQHPGPAAKVQIQHIEFSSDQTRALARVSFEDEGVREDYRIVLQKRYGDWTVASVWLSMQEEGAVAQPPKAPARKP